MADEMADERYRSNPVDRCYYCKSNLFAAIRGQTSDPIATGANTDDLSDWRPGLRAAAEHRVVHPYIEADLSKGDIYALAKALGLSDLARLPASPCLASRMETGLPVTQDDLAFVDHVEGELAKAFGAGEAIRCRITHDGVMIELSPEKSFEAARAIGEAECRDAGRPFLGVRPYVRGSAFLRGSTP